MHGQARRPAHPSRVVGGAAGAHGVGQLLALGGASDSAVLLRVVVLGGHGGGRRLLGQDLPRHPRHGHELGRHLIHACHRHQCICGHFGGECARREHAAEGQVHGLVMCPIKLHHLDLGCLVHGIRAGASLRGVQQRPRGQGGDAEPPLYLRGGRLLRLLAERDGRRLARHGAAGARRSDVCLGLLGHDAPGRYLRGLPVEARRERHVEHLWRGHRPRLAHLRRGGVSYGLAETRGGDRRAHGARGPVGPDAHRRSLWSLTGPRVAAREAGVNRDPGGALVRPRAAVRA
mmetsp:Transcript_65002/g.188469  ORF Transcript_65002/g.188469 Transcript_65002/m.188469 type:complete len:289 (+) Transcript_65002:808-1674(+)